MIELTILGSGSSGNSLTIKHQNKVLMIDAGFSGIELDRRLAKAGVSNSEIIAMLISHEHDDHVMGARTFSKRNSHITAYSNSLTTERLRMMNKAPESINIFANGTPFEIGPFTVEAFSVCHDAVDPVGFIIQCNGSKIGIATDFGYAGKMASLKLFDSAILIIESNHDPDLLRKSRRPAHLQHRILGKRGHLSNHSTAALLENVIGPNTKYLVLAHLSEDCNDPYLVSDMMYKKLKELNREIIEVIVAKQKEVGETIKL